MTLSQRKNLFLCSLLCLLVVGLQGCAGLLGSKQQPKPKEPAVVMLLPASGPYTTISGRIMDGARLAREELKKQGINLTLALLDTNASDWLKRLHTMPERFTVVGGPLEPKAYNKLKKSGLLRERAVFAFLNNLNDADEGQLAWRFFPSPKDQIEALVDFSTEQLKIRSFGAFYSTDAYSTKMLALFEEAVRAKNASLQKAVFASTDPKTLAVQARPLFNPTNPNSRRPIPQTAFEAVFLPASWKRVDGILASFMRNGEDRLVLLGTMGWEQSLAGKSLANASRYELALFPCAWNMRARVPALAKEKRDFWLALGYDFVLFAAQMGLPQGAQPSTVVARANRAAAMVKILAPISWDHAGIAHQKLYIARTSAKGPAPVDVAQFALVRAQRRESALLRLQGVAPASETSAEPVVAQPRVQRAPQAASEVLPEPPVQRPVETPIPTHPQASYKLSLPAKRQK